ncbi:thiamine-phosphate kinase [Rhodopirellula bahusiensis]|uniref:Thiamine-monophosphate kinase n=1 Tax=Rhodopirellula bahusiensis TaxID=2014065 RepID=A0A2G1W3Z0_9BACT|nr:thiamine-phosphate kinase [Rhodopirellula bahusiensis]PHQ33705.1 thiamine-monophosphate kinase [Rhodopirellula bahusiensis]
MEQSFLAYLRGRTRQLPQVAVGIGDDAAVIDWPGTPASDQPQLRQVACTDQILDGVDFRSQEQSLSDIGFKAMAINLSDIAAMGASPSSALVTLALPAENATEIAGEVYEGILEAAQKYNVAIAGGDLSTYDGPLSISITLLGWVEKPWLRTGAEEGDALFVTGSLGGSLLGRHLRPEPRVELAAKLKEKVDVHAAIDVSDGFSLDLDRMLAASRMGAELELETLPISEAAHRFSEKSGRTPLEHAWSDGEDFELIFCVSPEQAAIIESTDWGVPVTRVGKVVGRTGLWKRVATSKFERVFPQGFVHGEIDIAPAN